ncbi:conjugal transfer protein TraR [Marinitoga sp. 1135]|uniref:K+dependent Na+ exchanger related-protein n=1 Tax=Marinitoga piezophila (strain DSM 14283 / JCM 11233 / KA3) TaxID=443254 RepID=H2J578_MARPK|nr:MULTISPECIES: calcium/sodium antiporter [Marinitoga]AEX84936.1 K+dependent Na+ exchanger related-protein [Marinitoga piezophila KA3]APT75443.1 conjugal transfer protein TraR [Marinitoga sp. 1137]NUU95170.1 conjugal transfer protein TraR [Marinitoga sp. 1135]NUU97102.1 conjugal transfer protein TraR [Marinitoga sp. 1138]
MLLDFVLVVIGMILLIKGADYLISGAVGFSRKMGVSELFTGLTLVAFGTSAPELFVSISAAFKGSAGIALGNVIGSNIANIALILGLSSMVRKSIIKKSTLLYEIPFVILISMTLLFMLLDGNSSLSNYDGFMLLTYLIIFIAYMYNMAKMDKTFQEQFSEELNEVETKDMSWGKITFLSLLGIVMLAIGGDVTVNGASGLAIAMGLSETLIGVTIIALGTSLPELVTSIIAAKKGTNDILVGNLIGSNAFNILVVLGISASIHPIVPDRNVIFDAYYMVGIIILTELFMFRKREMGFFKGLILLLLYCIYIGISINIG